MKDWLFFPLALLLAIGIIAAAALPGRDRIGCTSVTGVNSGYENIVVAGRDLCRLEAAGEVEIERHENNGSLEAISISATVGGLSNRPDRNPHFRLAADIEHAFANSDIRVVIEAKPADDWGAASFEANYSAGLEGSSGWRTFRMTPGYQTYSFDWAVPERRVAAHALDYLAIRPIVPEKSRAITIKSVKLQKLRTRPKETP